MMHRFMPRASGAAAGFFSLLLAASAVSAAVFTVNDPIDPGDGTCDAVECTLREAIGAVNASTKKGVIDFDPQVFLMGTPPVISPTTGLPAITGSKVTIDGTGAGVVIDGSLLAAGEDGIAIESGAGQNLSKITVKGITVSGFPGNGLIVCGGALGACADDVSKVHIEDVVAGDNGGDGIAVLGAKNTSSRVIGSQVSRNSGYGIRIASDLANDLSKAEVSGCTARVNTAGGVLLDGDGDISRPKIEDSVAVSNGGVGFLVDAADSLSKARVSNLAGSFNTGQGLLLFASASHSRSTVSDSRFASNNGVGIDLNSSGKLERAKLTGNTALANNGPGIRLTSNTTVERAKLTGNLASDNQGVGIHVAGSRNLIKQNTASANLGEGILLSESGSRSRIQKNEVHANGAPGIQVSTPNGQNNVKQNRALGNDFFDLFEGNAACGTNAWTKNTFTSGNEPCIE